MRFCSRLLVLIPARDEEEALPATIAAWHSLGIANVRVVDNGSRDDTARVADRAGAEVVRETRAGYGFACAAGLAALPTGIDAVLISAADGSDRLDEADLARWAAAFDAGADLICGDRRRSAGSAMPFPQRLGNRVTCEAMSFLWGQPVGDLGSLRLLRRSALPLLLPDDRGFGWNVEMSIRAFESGCSVREIPVRYRPRAAGRSKISGTVRGTIRAGSAMLSTVVRLRARSAAALLSSRWRPRSHPPSSISFRAPSGR